MDTMHEERRKAIPALGFYPQEPISTGTTLIAMEYDGGVVVGTDSRTSAGSFISSRATNKITPITDYMSVCRSGSAADTQCIADIVKYFIEAYGMMENETLTIYRSTQIFRRFLYEYRDQLSASVLVAGWDEHEGGQGFLDSQWRPNMTAEECQAIVKQAVGLAIFRDGSSGGVVRLATINNSGTNVELFRPDKPGFPTVAVPPCHSSFPPHCQQTQA